jgi:hypothetical protein
MRKTLLALLLVVGACSPAETAETTTSTSGDTSSTNTAPPSTQAPSTTSGAPPHSTTTTTEATTTTTTALLEGTWADLPLITTGFGAIGWWDGSEWRDAATEGELPIEGGEDYQVTVVDELSRTTGGPQTTVCEPLELVGVELEEPDLLGSYPGPYGVAISAPWALQPYVFEAIADDGTYAGFASELLSARGMDVPEPAIKQLFRTDLEGDGVNEVLVVAEDVTQGLLLEPGDYSIAFMRKVVDGDVQTVIIEETLVFDEQDRFAGAHAFGGAADLNDDGRMELIVGSAFFEGFNVAVWEYANDDLGAVQVLLTGCGS